MEVEEKLVGEQVSIRLAGEASLRDVDTVHELLRKAFDTSSQFVMVDLSAIEKGGLPLLQLLVSARRTFSAHGREFTARVSAGHPLEVTAGVAGLADEIGFITDPHESGGAST